MQAEHIQLIRASVEQIRPVSGLAGACFYERLFELDPSLRPLFKTDLKTQGYKLMQTLRFIATNIDQLDKLVPVVAALGKRHRTYGVRGQHYETVGEALIWTLEHLMGPDFTSEMREAWLAAYTVLAYLMQSAQPESLQEEQENKSWRV